MREDLLKEVAEKEALVILTDSLENVIWESDKGPAVAMYGQYFEHQFSGVKATILYANQVGVVMGIIADRIPIRECHGVRMSGDGLKIFREMEMAVIYIELIPSVKSSKDDTEVYPIEQFLYDHRNQGEQRKSLEEHFKKS